MIFKDGQPLKQLITFDGEDEDANSAHNLPPIQQKMSVAQPEQEQVVNNFLAEYFKLYDNDREKLMIAYHDSALLSMSCAFPTTGKG